MWDVLQLVHVYRSFLRSRSLVFRIKAGKSEHCHLPLGRSPDGCEAVEPLPVGSPLVCGHARLLLHGKQSVGGYFAFGGVACSGRKGYSAANRASRSSSCCAIVSPL